MEEKVQYLLDRSEIQERIAIYGLGQDYHQPGFKNQDSYNEWSEVFSDDVQIDISDVVPGTALNLTQYIEMMRGKDGRGGGLDTDFRVWAHLEHPVKIQIEGDVAESVPFTCIRMKRRAPRVVQQRSDTVSIAGSECQTDGGSSSGG